METRLRPVEITLYLLRTIHEECTGPRGSIAKKFNITPDMVSQYVKKMELELSRPIAYCKVRNSYYFRDSTGILPPPII